jgi:hypothetical protein
MFAGYRSQPFDNSGYFRAGRDRRTGHRASINASLPLIYSQKVSMVCLGEEQRAAAEAEVGKILHSRLFRNSESLRRLLRFLSEKTIVGEADQLNDQLKEYSVGIDAFGSRRATIRARTPQYEFRSEDCGKSFPNTTERRQRRSCRRRSAERRIPSRIRKPAGGASAGC